MHKAFFVSALALPQLTYAGLTQDNYDSAPLLAAQISENISLVHEFGQTDTEAEADAEQAAFWDAYLSQVDAVLEEEANGPYWTDGFTSLSQAEVEALIESDTGVAAWGQKGGLAQLGADDYDKNHANILERAAHKVSKRAHSAVDGLEHFGAKVKDVGGLAIDKVGSMKMPTKAEVGAFLKKAVTVGKKAQEIKTKGLNFKNIAGQFLNKRVSTPARIVAIISTVIPGASEVASVAAMVANGSQGIGHILDHFNQPDDGKKKTCWIKSATRPFTLAKKSKCTAPRVQGVGPICYNACPAGKGKGLGPVCWGQCDATVHDKCGPLCLLKADKLTCKKLVAQIGIKALSIGVQAASGNYIGVVFTAFSVAGKLAYPICKDFNTGSGEAGEHEESGSGEI